MCNTIKIKSYNVVFVLILTNINDIPITISPIMQQSHLEIGF